MKFGFSFKSEPLWMIAFNVATVALGLIAMLIVMIIR